MLFVCFLLCLFGSPLAGCRKDAKDDSRRWHSCLCDLSYTIKPLRLTESFPVVALKNITYKSTSDFCITTPYCFHIFHACLRLKNRKRRRIKWIKIEKIDELLSNVFKFLNLAYQTRNSWNCVNLGILTYLKDGSFKA